MAERKGGPNGKMGSLLAESAATDPLLVRAETRVGSTLRDKWHLDAVLGVGGMATVYAATHRNGSRAAVKILHPEVSTNAFVREKFLWEGYAANSVGHADVVRVIDDDVSEDGSLFLVTELLDGETLDERRVRLGGHMPESEVLLITDQLLDVLAAAHAHGIVHCDLKPENVFLTRMGKIKVLDFGIARLGAGLSTSLVPQDGTVSGTPAYMAPEHARGLFVEIEERTDLWACGALMFRLLSGRGVHDGSSLDEELTNAKTRPAPALATVAPNIAAAIAQVVDRALAFDKDKRWPDARRMQEAVRQAHIEACGCPILTAPTLRIGEMVPNRTLPPAGALAIVPWTPSRVQSVLQPSSIPPVSLAADEDDRDAFRRAKPHRGALGVVAVAAGMAVMGMAWVIGAARANTLTRVSPAAQVTAPAAADPPRVTIAPLPVAEVSATDQSPARALTSAHRPTLVRSSPVRPAPLRTRALRSSTVDPPSDSSPDMPSGATPSSSPGCQPPYVVDPATGKKQWNLECLADGDQK